MAKGDEALGSDVLMQDEYSSDMVADGGETWVMDRLRLESGRDLHRVPVRYKTWGTLNDAGDNVLVVCHALTGNGARAHGVQPAESRWTHSARVRPPLFYVVCLHSGRRNVVGRDAWSRQSVRHR